MTRNYMHQWRLTRLLANDPCECGNRPRLGKGKGCAACEAIDAARYAAAKESLASRVRSVLRHHWPDWVDGVDVRDAVNDRESSAALWRLWKIGEVEKRPTSGLGNEYRLKQRRVA